MYVAGTPWPVLRDETAASRPSWTLFLEFKEGVATVVEAVAEGVSCCRRHPEDIDRLTGMDSRLRGNDRQRRKISGMTELGMRDRQVESSESAVY
jgi:hypothetical protein